MAAKELSLTCPSHTGIRKHTEDSNTGQRMAQLSSVGKCILSVVPVSMRTEVLQLRNEVKASQSQHRQVPCLFKQYQVASAALQDHLIEEYEEALASKGKYSDPSIVIK